MVTVTYGRRLVQLGDPAQRIADRQVDASAAVAPWRRGAVAPTIFRPHLVFRLRS